MRRDVSFLARVASTSALSVAVVTSTAVAQPQDVPSPDAAPSEAAPSEAAPAAPASTGAADTPDASVVPPASPAPTAEPDVTPTAVAPEPASVAEPAAPATSAAKPSVPGADAARRDRGLRFGSYGRVIAGTDLRGGAPESTNVVARAPRIVEPSYLELDFQYALETAHGMLVRPVITVAFSGNLFHDTGVFDASPALRNVYLDAQITKRVTAWAGSRMYRGDDIYLFDYWPLDDLNTVGAGVAYRKTEREDGGDALELAAHAGVNRLLHPFQHQVTAVPDPEHGATTVLQLNRQRMVASANAAYIMDRGPGRMHVKLKAHTEVHALPSGTRKRDDGTFEDLPSDSGWLAGTQVSLFGMSDDPAFRRHLNLYFRYAKGLAAFDELAPPTSFGPELKTTRASELQLGASGAWDHALGNVLFGAVSRRFIDADTTTTDPDDGWEYAVDVRPLARLGSGFFAGADVSYQARFPRGLNPVTLRAQDPAVFQIAPMLVFSPMGPSAYDRPQLRLVYRAAHLNEAARDLYVPGDPRHDRTWVHFLGVQAEWWFNSSRYQ